MERAKGARGTPSLVKDVPTSLVEAEDLRVRYPSATGEGRWLFEGLTFRITRGERVLLRGPSGCGKSTLLHAIAGLIPSHVPAEIRGTLLVEGKNPATLPPAERARLVGIVFQDPDTQFCTLTVEDEVAFGLENQRVPAKEMERRIEETLNLLSIGHLRDRKLSRLSGGEKQLVALASVLVLRPRLLLLDEVASNLDPENTALVYHALEGLFDRSRDLACLCVEHRPGKARAWINRMVALNREGEILREEDPAGLFEESIRTPGGLNGVMRKTGDGSEPWGKKQRKGQGECGEAPREEAGKGKPAETEYYVPLEGGGQDSGPVGLVEDLWFSYPANRGVLRGVNLEVRPGEIVALLGKNGSGKTTLLKILAGALRPDRGKVRVCGKDPALLSAMELSRCCSYLFQNPEHQFVRDTVAEELLQSLRHLEGQPVGMGGARDRSLHGNNGRAMGKTREDGEGEEKEGRREPILIARALLAQVGLEGKEDRNPFELSMGEKRRLTVACALAVGSRLILLDEPTFGQDAHTTQQIAELLKELKEGGRSILLVTHDREFSDAVADRVLRMEELSPSRVGLPAAETQQRDRTAEREKEGRKSRIYGEGGGGAASGFEVFQQYEKDSFLSKLNPLAKLGVSLTCMLLSTLLFDPRILSLWAGAAFLVLWVGGKFSPRVMGRATIPFFALGLGFLWANLLFPSARPPSELPLLTWGPLAIYGSSLWFGLAMVARSVTFGLFSFLFAGTTDPMDFAVSLMRQLRVSPRKAFSLLAVHRFLPLLKEEWEVIQLAHRMRGVGSGRWLRGKWERFKRYTIPLLAGAVRKADRLAMSMESRGLAEGERTFRRLVKKSVRDFLYVAGWALFLLGSYLLMTRFGGVVLWRGQL